MRKNGLLIVVLFTCISLVLGIVSCTYDYFEDEMNYKVFVPEILENSITDCRVMVYAEDGTLVKERYAAYPWGKDPREQAGIFSFRLLPGKYNVYCYTNTDSIAFRDVASLETAAFHLNEKNTENNTYVSPSDILYQLLTPTIVHPGIMIIDTAAVEKYTGRITVRFKNFPANASLVKDVLLNAEQAAVVQNFKELDVTGNRLSPADIMYHYGELPVQNPGANYLEVDHIYLPTANDGEIVTLNYTFLDSSGGTIIRLPVELTDRLTGLPMVLRSGERIIIEIDSYTIINVTVVDWDRDIQDNDTNLE